LNTNFVNIIKQIISQHGEAILGNPAQLKVFVRKYAKNEPKEVRLAFGRCIEQGYYRVLKQTSAHEERHRMKPKIAQQMHNISKLELSLCTEAVDILEAVLYGTQQNQSVPQSQINPSASQQTQAAFVYSSHLSKKTGVKIAVSASALILLIAGWIHWNTVKQEFQRKLNQLTEQIDGLLSSNNSSSNNSQETDENGLYAENYDSNGWAYINGDWVSNPKPGAFVRYADAQSIATASKPISNVVVNNNVPKVSIEISRNLSSIEDTYPLLRKVAEDLQYSDLVALQASFSTYRALPAGHFYEIDGKRFYSNQDLFDYKIQKAKEWGSKNDQNGDGEINCQDYAELFYKYASDAGYPVRYIVNSGLNHAFNQVKIQNEWISIEPQSAETGLNRPPLESVRFPAYNPRYDEIKKENTGGS
jgi:hypothetical protein